MVGKSIQIPSGGPTSGAITTEIEDLRKKVQVTFVYEPGGTTDGNVYATWAELITDHSSVAADAWKRIDFSDTFGVVTVPAGTYDMTNTTWGDHKRFGFVEAVTVNLADGVILTDLAEITDGLIVIGNNTTTPVMSVNTTGNTKNFFIGRGAILRNLGTEAFIELTGTGAPYLIFLDVQGVILGVAAPVIKKADTTVGCTIVFSMLGIMSGNSLEDVVGSTAFTFNIAAPSAVVNTSHSLLNTAVSVILSADANQLAFDNAIAQLPGSPIETQAAIEAIVNGFGLISTGTVSTTDATITEIDLITPASDSNTFFNVEVVGHRTGGVAGAANDGATYEIKFRLKKDGATPTVEDLESEYTSEDQIGWAITPVISGAGVSIRVTGAVDNNINWTSKTRFSEVT